MKYCKIVFLALFIMLFAMASVSAADDVIQEDLDISADSDVLSDDVEMDMGPEETFDVEDEDSYVTLIIPSGMKGDLTVKINGTDGGLDYDDEEYNFYVCSSGGQAKYNLPFDEDIIEDDEDPIEYYIYFDRLAPDKTYDIEFTFTPTTGEPYVFSSKITLVGEGPEIPEEIEISAEEAYIYNKQGNRIYIIASQSIMDNLIITINGEIYKLKKLNDEYYVDISGLPLGTYMIIVSYGDNSTNETFEVVNAIDYPTEMTYGDTVYVSLTLAEDATGNLTVTIDDKLIGNVQLVNGYAQIAISPSGVGEFNIEAKYVGEDYEIDDVDDLLEVKPKITFPSQMTVGDDKYLIFEVGDSEGVLLVEEDYEQYSNIRIKGSAKISLKNLHHGEITIDISYADDNNYQFGDEFEIDVKPVPIRIVANNVNVVYTKNAVFKVKIYDHDGKPLSDDVIDRIVIGNKVYRDVMTDEYGVATVKIPKTLAPGKYSIKVTFENTVAKKTLTVKHLLSLKKVSVKKSAKKLVLTATLKNMKSKKVVFKFNGKKYTAKTNKKGIAKVTIKSSVLSKLKVGKKVTYQATYLKDTVKKSVKVKR